MFVSLDEEKLSSKVKSRLKNVYLLKSINVCFDNFNNRSFYFRFFAFQGEFVQFPDFDFHQLEVNCAKVDAFKQEMMKSHHEKHSVEVNGNQDDLIDLEEPGILPVKAKTEINLNKSLRFVSLHDQEILSHENRLLFHCRIFQNVKVDYKNYLRNDVVKNPCNMKRAVR